MKRKRFGLILLGLAVALGLIIACSGATQKENNVAKVPVEVMTVKTGDVLQTLGYNGDIVAEYEVKVFSKIPDRIEMFYVDEGDFLKRSARIAKIVATTIEQGVRQAEAGLAAARAQELNVRVEYERAQRLFKESAMSKQQYDIIETQYEAAKAGLQQAEAALKSAKSQLADATVTAPISGIIGKRYFEAGDMASPAMPLVTVVQMDRVKITFEATETDLGKLAIGQKALLNVKAYPGETFEGKVTKISPVLDPVTRMAKVEILMDNPNRRLKPGMFATVQVQTGALEDVIIVPRFATIENTSMRKINGKDQVVTNYFVYVVNDSTAEQRRLEVDYVNHIQLAVASGVQVGDLIVVTGQANLRDGSPVNIVQREGDTL